MIQQSYKNISPGVTLRIRKLPSGKEDRAIVAYFGAQGGKRKSFSVRKYGYDEALALAQGARADWVAEWKKQQHDKRANIKE